MHLRAGQLRKWRTRQQLTQQQLADAVGITMFHVSRLERGTSGGTLRTMTRIADALKVDVGELVTFDEDEATAAKN